MRAASEGRIWALRRSLFRSIQTRPVAMDQTAHSPASTRFLRALRASPALAPLSFGQLQRLAFFMRLVELKSGQELVSRRSSRRHHLCPLIFVERTGVLLIPFGKPFPGSYSLWQLRSLAHLQRA